MWKLILIFLFFYCVLSEKETKGEEKKVVAVEHKEVKYGGPPVDEFYAETTETTSEPTTEP